jgi:hypothetical protein
MSTPNKSSLEKVSDKTNRTLRVWLKGKKDDLPVYRIPIAYLYFNIENGRYADKMLQLKADNPGVDIDPTKDKWKEQIFNMLKGTYKGGLFSEGTEKDKVEFNRLKEDIKKREQLDPGIVLSDGGVIDGNRRLAVLMDIKEEKFNYFDGVILPENISSEDRWRIEVGLQMGKDQRLDYNYINKLLKIRQGLTLFKNIKLLKGETPEGMVAKALYGIKESEILFEIERIKLIDEFLDFFNMKEQYYKLTDHGERFIEAVNILKATTNLPLHQKAKLKAQIFVIIKESLMINREMRDIRKALGGDAKARGRKSNPVKKAIEHFIMHSTDPKNIKEAYINNNTENIIKKSKELCNEFHDIFEAETKARQPIELVKDAKTKLETLKESLKTLINEDDGLEIFNQLIYIRKLVKACTSSIKLPKRKYHNKK